MSIVTLLSIHDLYSISIFFTLFVSDRGDWMAVKVLDLEYIM